MKKTIFLISVLLALSISLFGAKMVTESFFEMDIRQALSQIAYTTGETIIADDTVGGYVTMDLNDVTLEKALDLLLLPGGYSWVYINGIYFVSRATPDSDKFMYFATTKEYRSKNYKASELLTLLPQYMRKYVNVSTSQSDPYTLTVTAPKDISDRITELLSKLDKNKREIELEITVVEVDESVFRKWEREWGYRTDVFGTSTSFSISGEWFSLNILNLFGQLSGNFNLNKTDQNAKILSESSVRVVDGVQSKIFSKTSRMYQYVVDTTTYYREISVGMETNILPLLMGNGVVLNISQNLFSAEEVGSSVPSSVQQGIQTTVMMNTGTRMAVASLSFKNLVAVESKIPLLGDIPLVGKLFTQIKYEDVRKRVVLFVAAKDGGEL